MKALTHLALAVALFTASSTSYSAEKPIKAYPGHELPLSELVTIRNHDARALALVLKIDGKTTSSCMINCMFRRPVQISPGKHTFSTDNFSFAPAEKVENSTADIPENAHEAAVVDRLFFATRLSFTFDETLVAGKSYELRLGHRRSGGGDFTYYVWWQELPPQ